MATNTPGESRQPAFFLTAGRTASVGWNPARPAFVGTPQPLLAVRAAPAAPLLCRRSRDQAVGAQRSVSPSSPVPTEAVPVIEPSIYFQKTAGSYLYLGRRIEGLDRPS